MSPGLDIMQLSTPRLGRGQMLSRSQQELEGGEFDGMLASTNNLAVSTMPGPTEAVVGESLPTTHNMLKTMRYAYQQPQSGNAQVEWQMSDIPTDMQDLLSGLSSY